MNALQKLRQTVDELRADANPLQTQAAWDLAGRLLSRMPVDGDEVSRACVEHDIGALDALVVGLEQPKAAPKQPVSDADAADVPEREQIAALRAFRKRLKLTRIAEESKLGGRQLTGGRSSQIDAIIAPTEFPQPVWDALAKSGRLKDTGQGFYALP